MRRASSLILLQKRKGGEGINVLLSRRSEHLRFLPGRHSFPGGVSEQNDLSFARSLSPSSSFLCLSPPPPPPPLSVPFLPSDKITAIRETFEETGILLGAAGSKELGWRERKEWRRKVREDSSQFYALFSSLSLAPNLEDLHLWAHWITPSIFPIRFDTRFLLFSSFFFAPSSFLTFS